MSQYYNANKAEIDEVAATTQEIYEYINGENGLTTQMSQYYNANKTEIDENASKIALLEDSMNEIANPSNPDSLVNRLNEQFGEFANEIGEMIQGMQAQIEALQAKIAQLEGK